MEPQVKRALLVETEFIQADNMVQGLTDAGFQVNQPRSAEDAAILLMEPSNQFDIAVVRFPFQDDQRAGTIELLNHLRALSMPRIVVSVLDRGELEGVYPLEEGDVYIAVPFRRDELATAAAKRLKKDNT